MGLPDIDRIFSICSDEEFNRLALEVFRYQAAGNPVYTRYLELIGRDPDTVKLPEDIPFMPIEFFREHRVLTDLPESVKDRPGPEGDFKVFESSGTTSERASRHYVADTGIYRESFTRGFKMFYGEPTDYTILALLPSYLERENSSLVYMAEHLIRLSGQRDSGFYLDNLDELNARLQQLEKDGRKTLLLGVSFALADLAENYPVKLQHTTVMETGGMKGRRIEMTREELHGLLTHGFGVSDVHSEYGMTELLSQAYSSGNGIFFTPPWMKIYLRDPYDPFSSIERNSSGGINIIDLANLHSCSFIATQDIGRYTSNGGFTVLGRFDNSEIRGCNLMVE